MQELKVLRVMAAAAAVAMMAACGDSYVPTAPSFPQGLGLVQPAQPDQPPPPDQPCSKGTPSAARFAALLACDTVPVKGAQPKNHDQ
jgi:hypothetical protein